MNETRLLLVYIILPLFVLLGAHIMLRMSRRLEREEAYATGYHEARRITEEILTTHAGPTPQAALVLAELEAAAPHLPEDHDVRG